MKMMMKVRVFIFFFDYHVQNLYSCNYS